MLHLSMQLFNDAMAFTRNHIWHAFLIAVALHFLSKQWYRLQFRLSGQSLSSSRSHNRQQHQPNTINSRDEEIQRIRERQQQLLQEASKQREREKHEKERIEKERKNTIARKPDQPGGRRLNDTTTSTTNTRPSSSSSSSSYNPMQPWTSNAGGGYRPTRRTVNRGGG